MTLKTACATLMVAASLTGCGEVASDAPSSWSQAERDSYKEAEQAVCDTWADDPVIANDPRCQ